MSNLLTDVEILRISDAVAAGQGTTKCTIVDMKGYDEATFIVDLGTVTNNGSVTLQIAQGDENDTSKLAVSTATTGAIKSDGTIVKLTKTLMIVTVTQPMHRYLEAQVVKADQNAVIDGAIAILSKARKLPIAQGATISASKVFQSPGAA
jgi:hypothetical protein